MKTNNKKLAVLILLLLNINLFAIDILEENGTHNLLKDSIKIYCFNHGYQYGLKVEKNKAMSYADSSLQNCRKMILLKGIGIEDDELLLFYNEAKELKAKELENGADNFDRRFKRDGLVKEF